MTSSAAPVDIITSLYAAIERRDFGNVEAMLVDDFVADAPAGQAVVGGRYEGRAAAISGLWGRLVQAWEDLKPHVREYVAQGGTVVTLGHYTGRNRDTGRPLQADFAHVWRVDGGRVVALKIVTDTYRWNIAWGRIPESE